MLLRDHGSWELHDILQFAIDYARNGHLMLDRVAETIASVAELFAEHWPTSADQWIPGSILPTAGALVINRDLARTLERLAEAATGESRQARIDAARREWSEGFVAEAIVDFTREPHRHSTGRDHAGIITAEDLAGFRATYEDAVFGEFRGHAVAKPGLWSQGPVLLQSLAILSGFDDDLLDPSTGIGAHAILEAQKLAFADRETYYGDDIAVPLEALLSAGYTEIRRAVITNAASLQLRPGVIPGLSAILPNLVDLGTGWRGSFVAQNRRKPR